MTFLIKRKVSASTKTLALKEAKRAYGGSTIYGEKVKITHVYKDRNAEIPWIVVLEPIKKRKRT